MQEAEDEAQRRQEEEEERLQQQEEEKRRDEQRRKQEKAKPMVKATPVRHKPKPKTKKPTPPPPEEEEPIDNSQYANFYTEAAMQDPDAENVQISMAQCSICGRKFAADRLQKHMKVCKTASQKKRKVFDPVKMRTEGMEHEKYAKDSQRKPEPKVKFKFDNHKLRKTQATDKTCKALTSCMTLYTTTISTFLKDFQS